MFAYTTFPVQPQREGSSVHTAAAEDTAAACYFISFVGSQLLLSHTYFADVKWITCPISMMKTTFNTGYSFYRGPGSVVGIATGYGLDGPGIESRWGGEIFLICPDRP